ncbi:aminoglycoside phosphotransferase family protein [Arsenicibacter rosenii]|uniref:Aminoglycoside phosphotransferase domain-containing protein n=1 Tax=Arsenicibacter rosenii TaxID=1750698 RepID=A0A1S2VD42_9BACT|nr:aminoglycoside phosphotransferase family protein [Arsenicibacter rosenii]OIN56623.1 hypothetical protein BLX24_23620 [Arsenicibacter rosenii]
MQTHPFFSPAFIETLMQQRMPEQRIRVQHCEPLPIDNSASILVTLTAGISDKLIGHFAFRVHFTVDGQPRSRKMVMKIKPNGDKIAGMLTGLAQLSGEPLASTYPPFQAWTGFQHTHMRETLVYRHLTSPILPAIFGVHIDPVNDLYIILMEYLDEVTLMNSTMTPDRWTDTHIRTALTQLAAWHASYLRQPLPFADAFWSDAPSAAYMLRLRPLWQALFNQAVSRFPDLYPAGEAGLLQQAIDHLPAYWGELEQVPKTFIHNDLNPRNTCFKETANGLQFCVYDWELATYHIPQYDVAEFLCFVLDTDRYALRQTYLEFYRGQLHALTGTHGDPATFRRHFALAALDFGLHRLGLYMMAHSVSPYPFLPRVVASYLNTLSQFRTDVYDTLFSKSA